MSPLRYPLLKWQTLSNMSAANNSFNEVLGNNKKPNDFRDS